MPRRVEKLQLVGVPCPATRDTDHGFTPQIDLDAILGQRQVVFVVCPGGNRVRVSRHPDSGRVLFECPCELWFINPPPDDTP